MFIALTLLLNGIFAQENLFIKPANFELSKEASEKIERYKLREDLKNWELVHLKSIISPSKGFKGIFNIMDNSFEFEITKKINKVLPEEQDTRQI